MGKYLVNKIVKKGLIYNMTIIGKWKIVDAELGGLPIPAQGLEKMVLEMDETSYQLSEEKVIDSGLIDSINNTSPKALVVAGLFGPNKGKTFQCIYKFEGEDLIMCYNLGGDGIPEKFETIPNSLLYLVRYRRI
jgi:uncharacterized protein (TIGR03067 family)